MKKPYPDFVKAFDWISVFDDGDTGSSDGDTGSSDGNTGSSDGDTGSGSDDDYTGLNLTPAQQKHMNEKIEKRIAREKKNNAETIQRLKTLESTIKMSEEERKKLKGEIERLENATLTEKELAAKARKEDAEKSKKAIDELSSERDTWRSRYEDSTIEREILDAATRQETKAWRPAQIVAELRKNTQLVEVTEDGVGTGKYVARVKFEGRDSDNKPLTMDLTVAEAVDEMYKMPDVYGNLFESGLKNGLGSNNIPGTGSLSEASFSSQDAYKKNREKILKG